MNTGKTQRAKLRGGLLFALFTGPALLFVLFATDIPFLDRKSVV